jgi:hypothetical protein
VCWSNQHDEWTYTEGAGVTSMILSIEIGCWNNHHDNWRYTEVAGIIIMMTGDTQKLLELSA